MERSKPYYPYLTGIRAIAAYVVFIHHHNPFDARIFGQRVHDMADELHIGVTIFFVLSGFLIADRYYDTVWTDLRDYFFRRFARIYPMFFLLVSGLFVSHAIFKHQHNSSDLVSYLMSITFLKGFFDHYKFTGISQSWSLTVEALFYLSAPMILLLLSRSRVYLILIPLLLTAIGCWLVYMCIDLPWYGFMGSYRFMFWYTFFGRSPEFFAGICLALLWREYGDRVHTRYITWLGVVTILLSLFLLSSLRDDVHGYLGINAPLGIAVNNLFLPFIGVVPLFWGLMTEQTLIRRVLSSRLLLLLGRSSYAFYLIHLIFIHSMSGQNFLTVFVLSNIASILLYKAVEEPLNKLLGKWWVGKSALLKH